MPRVRFKGERLITLALILSSLGCLSMTAIRIVKAPNLDRRPSESVSRTAETLRPRSFQYMSGQPPVPLEATVIEPGDYALRYDLKSRIEVDGHGSAEIKFNYSIPNKAPGPQPSKGTILLLHGIRLSKESMLPWALSFAQAGFRAVLVDLRGHGNSGGRWVGFGAFEVDDLVSLLDHLQGRMLASEKVGVLGISYGGSIALQLAGKDPRIGAVVALAPFSDARQGILQFLRGAKPGLAGKWREDEFFEALDPPAKKAGFAWSAIDVKAAMARTKAPVLLVHGMKDTWIPPEHSRVLAQQSSNATLRLRDEDNHISLSLRLDAVFTEAEAFFGRHLPAGQIPK